MDEKILDMLAELAEDEIVKENLDIDLFETGLLDSLAFVELLFRMEDEFDIVISPSEIAREDINTPNKVLQQVKKRVQG